MMNCEERYEYVIKRCGEIRAEKRKNRITAVKIAAPVCCAAVAAGAFGVSSLNRGDYVQESAFQQESGFSSESVSSAASSLNSGDYVHESASQQESGFSSEGVSSAVSEQVTEKSYSNDLNIGEVEIAENVQTSLFCIPCLYEMTRNEVLEHFGLSTDFDLSGVVDGLRETAPDNGVLNGEGKHGFFRGYTVYENDVGSWEELYPLFDNDEFVFENEDGTKYAKVIFSHEDRINWLRSGMMCIDKTDSAGNARYSSLPFYELPASVVAGVEMRIAKKDTGGYYAEFNTDTLSVGLVAKGLSESEIVDILEYLAKYTGAGISDSTDVSVGAVEMPKGDLVIH